MGALHADHARVGAESGVQLAVAHVHGVDLDGAPLQQAVREAAGRGSHVQSQPPVRVDPESVQGRGELEPAPRDVRDRILEDLDARLQAQQVSGLGVLPSLHPDLAGHDGGLGFGARREQAFAQQQHVETFLLHRLLIMAYPPAP